jgi:O-antigen ligase
MDRVLILIVMMIIIFIWLSKDGLRLSYAKFTEALVTIFVFSCCFTRLNIPFYSLPYEHQYGPFGAAFRIEVYHVFMLILLWIVAQRTNLKFNAVKKSVVLAIIFYLFYTVLNPYNVVKASSFIALNYFITYVVFLYLLVNCCSVETLIKGVYNGLRITIVFQLILVLAFALTRSYAIVRLFNADAITRRGVSPGSFGHPNALGAYMSFCLMFFVSCYVTKFRQKDSAIYAVLAIAIIIMSASRSALLACAFGIVVIVVMYVFRRYSIFNAKILLQGVLPISIALLLAYNFTPLGDMFGASSDADDMVIARYMHYYCAYEIFEDHPLIGVGLNSHLRYLQDNSALVDIETMFEGLDIWLPEDFIFHNPIHNIWLIMLTEFGIIGVIPILCFIVYYFVTFKKKIRNSNSKYYNISAISGLGILSYMFVHGNTDWALYTPTMLNISLLFLYVSETKQYSLACNENELLENE